MGRAEGAEETLGVGRYAGKTFEEAVMGAAGNSHLLALRHRRRHVLLEIRLTLRRVFHLPGEPSREETHRASSRARTALRCTAENQSYLPLLLLTERNGSVQDFSFSATLSK